MSLYVRIVEGQVKDVWDSPPPNGVGNDGWMNAVEIKPEIVHQRQDYTPHIFDLTKDPVEIKYGTKNISVTDRKDGVRGILDSQFHFFVMQQLRIPSKYDTNAVSSALNTMLNQQALIDVATTHNQLDAIASGTSTTVEQVLAITEPDPTLTEISY
jgi:hypothetical protein